MHSDKAGPADDFAPNAVMQHGGEDRFRQVVECAPNAMVIVNSRGEIEMVNVATERLFGYARRELLGMPVEMLVPHRHRSTHAGSRGTFFDGARDRPMSSGRELDALRHDGTEFPVEIGLNRIETLDGTLVLSSIIETSGRRRLEERLRLALESLHQAEKMEALGRMTSGIAHDFSNMLTVIAGNLDRLATGGEVSSARGLRALDLAVRGSERAARLTAQLLAFSRRQVLEPAPMEANRVVAGLPDMLSETLGAAIDIRILLTDLPWSILVDESLLEDALLNLAINARDAMPGGGTLTIETSNVHVDGYALTDDDVEPGDYGVLSVTDTGCGMSEETRKKVFEPFFTTKQAGRGTGLGLAQVYGFVTQSGGFVRVRSVPGSGSVFVLYFPRAHGGGERSADVVRDAAAVPATAAASRLPR